ncbi:52 kDa repressor of the inhibitor of the protein kinase-like [Sipha flava]|uniref:52 kDa repressor of the inhibitor of the protein kinase-like n=1 Tax=Sipha flava TaxID=143950 RepID=A0A2S2QL19_9HEMI|nr:52 kDa repressor of the inhibitor of the protein kinase-like [Sipha flava]
MWRRHCSNTPEEKRPKTLIDTLNFCEFTSYQSIHRFMHIRATLPISVTLSERSFSCFHRLKTYLRNKTAENRLNGLALFNIYRNVKVSCKDILDTMAKIPKWINLTL